MKRFLLTLAILSSLIHSSELSAGEIQHSLLRRIAVFPVADANFSSSEEAWWQMRDLLTKNQRLMVATRRFMINRGVFQARKILKPADVIILSKILDAQALVVSFVEDRIFKMKVYEAENGILLWESEIQFHPALPIADQLVRVSTKMISDFSHAIPYQGFIIVDEVIGKPVYEVADKKHVQVFQGIGVELEVGDPVQFIKVFGDVSGATFGKNLRTEVVGEGQVVKSENGKAQVEVLKLKDFLDLTENALVRFPNEVNKLRELYIGEDRASSLGTELLSTELKKVDEFKKDHNSTSTTLAFIANLMAMILIAF